MNNSTSPIVYYPFYYSSSPQVLSFVSDKTLSLFLPIICYWLFSLFFIALDYLSPRYPYLMKHKIHTEPDPNPNNLVGHAEVVSKVLLQQALQVVVSLLAVKDGDIGFWPADHRKGMQLIQPYLLKAMQLVLGTKTGFHVFSDHRERLLSFTYWWGIPVLQFFLAIVIIDTWQYWIHRLVHEVSFLYRHLHQTHHRLHAPYGYAALYAHPIEALLLEIFGAALAFTLSGMTPRQGMVFFVFSTCKAVDDHCGYNLPYDPFQLIFGDSAPFHDVHHQAGGVNKNFSQPFFNVWDILCGTYEAPPPSRLEKSKKE